MNKERDKEKKRKKKRKSKRSSSLCIQPPRIELWAIALGFIILMFFIEIVSRLENEWKVKWESLGMLDEDTNNRIQNGDLSDYQYASPIKITPDFDPILNQLASEANLDSDALIAAPSDAGGLLNNGMIMNKEGQTSNLNFDNGLLAEKNERPPAPIPKTKLTAKNRSEFADLISQYADYTNMTSEEVKSIDIIIPINERGNSSSTLRMIHRQWYNKIQFQLSETHQIKNYKSANNIRISENLNVKIRLRFILSGPIGASKASTLDKYFNDLYSHDKRIFQTLPDDILDTLQCCTDVVVFLHSSFVLLTLEGIHAFRRMLTGEEEFRCFGLTSDRCIQDTVAFGRKVQLKVEEGSITLDKYIQDNREKDGLAMSPGSAINQMSVSGLENKFLDEVDGYAEDKTDGFDIPNQYYNEGDHNFDTVVLHQPTNMCTGRAKHLFFIVSRFQNFEIRSRVRNYMLTDGGNQAPNFEMYFLIGTDENADDGDLTKLNQEYTKFNDIIQISAAETFFSFATQAHLIALNLQQSCDEILSVTHFKDTYKLNIRRLFKEYLTPGVPEDKIVCLDKVLDESQPDYFMLSSFVWYSNWPSRYHKLPSRCATATFTISSKTASQIDSHFHTMTWRDLHNSELFITGILRKLIGLENPLELWICKPDPELRVNPQEPQIDQKTKRIY